MKISLKFYLSVFILQVIKFKVKIYVVGTHRVVAVAKATGAVSQDFFTVRIYS